MNEELLDALIGNVRRGEHGRQRSREWTREDDRYYLDHLVDMTIEEIGEALGRSANAVKIHRFRAGLPSHRRTPGYLTTHQVALILGVDGHNPPIWVDHGILPGERVPSTGMLTRRISWMKFKMWLVKPTSWFYFKPERMKNESLRSLVLLAKRRWGDEWWSLPQAAAYHHCDSKDILRYVKHGDLPAVQAPLIGGRNPAQGWAYWFAKKSDVLRLKVDRQGDWPRGDWTDRGDAFIIRARAEGKRYEDIARMMGWKQKRVEYRAKLLKIRQIDKKPARL